jgi:hypothetical protein|tara:strand:- start:1136 stop:1243 length:108 start_codon:yes stop_codon:yes gene_type:complete
MFRRTTQQEETTEKSPEKPMTADNLVKQEKSSELI